MKKNFLYFLMSSILFIGCIGHNMPEYRGDVTKDEEIKENVMLKFGTVFDENHDWCVTSSGEITINSIPSDVYKVQLMTYIEESDTTTSLFILNEAYTDGSSTVTLSYDMPSDNLGMYAMFISNGTYSFKEITSNPFDFSNKAQTRNTATDYEVHAEKTQVIPLDTLQLRGFEGYRDRIYREDGKWYKHKEISDYTITGNEGWTWTIFNDPTTETPNTTEFHAVTTNLEIINNSTILCNKFRVYHPSTDTEFLYFIGNTICINILTSRLSVTTPEAFVTWLQSNPIELVYASSITEPDEEVSTTLRRALNATLRLAPYKDYSFFPTRSYRLMRKRET